MPDSHPSARRRPLAFFTGACVAVWLFLALAALTSCGRSSDAPAGRGGGSAAVPVVAGEVAQKDMPVTLPGIGNVRAFSQVSIKPRVSGQVEKVMFTEGQEVNEGDVLLTIDPKPFDVALTQAKARLEQARSVEELARIRADRGMALQKSGAVAREENDQLQNALRVAKANVEVENAAVRGAELQLSYCTIQSPIRGRTGRRAVDAGNVVKADETELMTIHQLRPIEVVFSLPEQHLGEITRQMRKAKDRRQEAILDLGGKGGTNPSLTLGGRDTRLLPSPTSGELQVTIKPNEDGAAEALGSLTFIDNAVKTATGTIEMKAQFPNEDLVLWPGQYGEVTLTLSVQKGATVVPSAAVQTGQTGSFVWVIKKDNTVEVRPIKVERVLREESVIREGLKPGELVVVDGQLRLIPGAKVELKPPVGSEHARGSAPIAQDGRKGGTVP